MAAQATTITIYVDETDKAQVEEWAAEDDRSVSSLFRRLIEAERARRQNPQANKNHTAKCFAAEAA